MQTEENDQKIFRQAFLMTLISDKPMPFVASCEIKTNRRSLQASMKNAGLRRGLL